MKIAFALLAVAFVVGVQASVLPLTVPLQSTTVVKPVHAVTLVSSPHWWPYGGVPLAVAGHPAVVTVAGHPTVLTVAGHPAVVAETKPVEEEKKDEE